MDSAKFSVSLDFEEVSLPPFQDILILGRKCPQGRMSVSGCLNLLAPDHFELIELDDAMVEAVLINKKILSKLPASTVVGILRERVFPFITKGEMIKVELRVRISYDSIEGTLE